MGFMDIFYQEINRFRDKSISEKEKKEIIKTALKKTLKKFIFLWEDQVISRTYKFKEIKDLLSEFSGEFMDLAVKIDESFEGELIVNNLREISRFYELSG
jgi:hypothetical protein